MSRTTIYFLSLEIASSHVSVKHEKQKLMGFLGIIIAVVPSIVGPGNEIVC